MKFGVSKKRYADFKFKKGQKYCDIYNDVLKYGYVGNIIFGGRGLRKSSNILRDYIIEALENVDYNYQICEKRFVWMRLNDTTIQKVKESFLSDFIRLVKTSPDKEYKLLREKLLKGKVIGVRGNHICIADNIKDLNKKDLRISIGQLLPLSDFTQRSIPFTDIYNIHYDEFINEGRVMFDEFKALQYILDSVARENEHCRVILSANAITYNHPLLQALGIVKLKENSYTFINEDHHKWILILNYPPSEKLIKDRKKTIGGFLGSLNDYNEMANENSSRDDYEAISNINWKYAEPFYALSTGKSVLYLYWYGYKIYVSNRKHDKEVITIKSKGLNNTNIKVDKNKSLRDSLVKANYKGNIIFENLKIKELFYASINT